MGYFVAFLLLGGVLGSALAVLIAKLVPALSVLKENLTAPLGFNIEVVNLSVRLNIGAVAGMIAGAFVFRKA